MSELVVVRNPPTPAEVIKAWWEAAEFCECGRPQDVMALVRDTLAEIQRSWGADEGAPAFEGRDPLRWLLAYCLDAWGLTEHGGGVGGAWLTEEGERLLGALCTVDLETALA